MQVATMSDIHGKWDWHEIKYPPADILIIAGDILKNYNSSRMLDAQRQINEVYSLNAFLKDLKDQKVYEEIFVIAGNHDFAWERLPNEASKAMSDVVYLKDSEATFKGLKFYGSPWQPWFWDWAFNFPNHNSNFARARTHARRCWDQIPVDTDVLITHGPPRGILDEVPGGERVGCQWLAERLKALTQLKLHVFGHIHLSHGQITYDGFGRKTQFVNAAICKEDYSPTNPIQVVTI